MAGVITTGNHPKALVPGVKAWWGRAYNEHTPEYPDLFDKDTSNKHFEEDVLVTGFALAPIKPEGEAGEYDSESQGFTKRYTHVAYALGFMITFEENRDNLYAEVSKRRAPALAFSFRQTKENVAANVYNRAWTAAYTGGDGVELCSEVHVSKAGTWANEPAAAADLSEASIEDGCIAIMGYTNDRGLKINLMPQSLHIHRNDWYEANRILKSVLQSDTANNDINALRSTNSLPKGIKMNHYFSDTDAWFIRTNVPRGMIYYERDPIMFDMDNDFDTKNLKWLGYERYSFGWTDPRAVWGNPGA